MCGKYKFMEPITKGNEIVDYRPIEEDSADLNRRLAVEVKRMPRFMTGYKDLDSVLGGLPVGLTIVNGSPGSGKSMLCKAIASKHKTLYVCAESMDDAPTPTDKVFVLDFIRYLPGSDKAVRKLFAHIQTVEPDIVFIDSLTMFLSGTKAAVMEADVREGAFKISGMAERVIPIVGISEMRGSGNYQYSAGGTAVDHAASMLITMDKTKINKWNAKKYNAREGDIVYSLEVAKDRQGYGQSSSEYQITYDAGNPILRKISYADTRQKEE